MTLDEYTARWERAYRTAPSARNELSVADLTGRQALLLGAEVADRGLDALARRGGADNRDARYITAIARGAALITRSVADGGPHAAHDLGPLYASLNALRVGPRDDLVCAASELLLLCGTAKLWHLANVVYAFRRALGPESRKYQWFETVAALVWGATGPGWPPFDAAWRTGTAAALAARIYDDQDWSGCPILADALQEAGTPEDHPALAHLRGDGPKFRGMWILDKLIGKR